MWATPYLKPHFNILVSIFAFSNLNLMHMIYIISLESAVECTHSSTSFIPYLCCDLCCISAPGEVTWRNYDAHIHTYLINGNIKHYFTYRLPFRVPRVCHYSYIIPMLEDRFHSGKCTAEWYIWSGGDDKTSTFCGFLSTQDEGSSWERDLKSLQRKETLGRQILSKRSSSDGGWPDLIEILSIHTVGRIIPRQRGSTEPLRIQFKSVHNMIEIFIFLLGFRPNPIPVTFSDRLFVGCGVLNQWYTRDVLLNPYLSAGTSREETLNHLRSDCLGLLHHSPSRFPSIKRQGRDGRSVWAINFFREYNSKRKKKHLQTVAGSFIQQQRQISQILRRKKTTESIINS